MKTGLWVGMLALLVSGTSFSNNWVFGPTLPFGYSRFDGEFYPPTGRAFFLGGRMLDGTTSGEVWSFMPDSGTFRDEGLAMEQPISNYTVNLLKDVNGPDSFALYVATGWLDNGSLTPALQVYYPISGLATSLTSDPFPGRVSGHPYFVGQGQIVCNNKLYCFGGYETSAAPYNSDSTYVYDPSLPAGSRWAAIPTALLSLARGDITPAIVDGKIYAIGGESYDGALLHPTNRVERFDPSDPRAGWVRMVDFPDSLMGSQAFGFDTGSPYGLGNHIIVAGNAGLPDCFDYDVAANSWSGFAPLNRGRTGYAGFFVPGYPRRNGVPGMWVCGGSSDSSSEYYGLNVAVESHGVLGPGAEALRPHPSPNPFVFFTTMPGHPSDLFTLYDISGRKVGVFKGDRIGQGLPAGVYFIKPEGKEGKPLRIVKVR